MKKLYTLFSILALALLFTASALARDGNQPNPNPPNSTTTVTGSVEQTVGISVVDSKNITVLPDGTIAFPNGDYGFVQGGATSGAYFYGTVSGKNDSALTGNGFADGSANGYVSPLSKGQDVSNYATGDVQSFAEVSFNTHPADPTATSYVEGQLQIGTEVQNAKNPLTYAYTSIGAVYSGQTVGTDNSESYSAGSATGSGANSVQVLPNGGQTASASATSTVTVTSQGSSSKH